MIRPILAISLALLLGACSDRPSDRAGRQAFEQFIRDGVGDTEVRVAGFRKTDGQAFVQDGVKGYRLFYTSDVAFPRGYRPDCLQRDSFEAGLKCAFVGIRITGLQPVPPGSTVSLAGNIVFQRTEKGWIPGQVEVAQTGTAAAGKAR